MVKQIYKRKFIIKKYDINYIQYKQNDIIFLDFMK